MPPAAFQEREKMPLKEENSSSVEKIAYENH